MENSKKRAAGIRLVIQIFVFALVFLITISKWMTEKGIKFRCCQMRRSTQSVHLAAWQPYMNSLRRAALSRKFTILHLF